MSGAKPDLNKGSSSTNVACLPGADFSAPDQPSDQHIARAKELLPKRLKGVAKKVWISEAPIAVSLGRLKLHYVMAFTDLCETQARVWAWLDSLGLPNDWTYESKTRNGVQLKMHPTVGQFNEDRRMLRSLRGDFGMTPVADRAFNSTQGDMFDNEFTDL